MKKPTLFLLHFAGGNCYSYHALAGLLPEFEVVAPELPGRGRRMMESLLLDFDTAGLDVYRQVLQRGSGSRCVIYGHSLGAYLALRVTGLLEEGGIYPVCAIVSGNAGPGIGDHKKTYLLPHDEFVKDLERLGGVPPEVIEHEDLFGFFEPILRSDFQLAENNGMDKEQPVKTPLHALMGSLEENRDHITNWARFTRSGFSYEILSGDHFFINHHRERIAQIIREQYHKTGYAQESLSPNHSVIKSKER